MCYHLDLFELGLTSELPDLALILAPRPQDFIAKDWIVGRNLRQRHRLVLHHFEVKLFEALVLLQIVKARNRGRFNLLHERRDICLVLQRKS